MKELQPDDPRLTAYMLGELPPREAEMIAERLQSNSDLALDVAKTQALGKLLCETYEKEGLSLHPVQRAAIRQVGQNQEAYKIRSVMRRSDVFRGIGLSLAAAASVTLVLLILAKTPVSSRTEGFATSAEELNMDVVLSPAALVQWGEASLAKLTSSPTQEEGKDGSAKTTEEREAARLEFTERITSDPQRFFAAAELTARRQHLPEAESFIPLSENDYLSSREQPTTAVPVMAGRTSFAWVERYLRERGELPPRDAVRLEELVNYPDYIEEGHAQVGGVSLSSELVPCPWNEECLLLVLLLQRVPGSEAHEEVFVNLEIDEQRVGEYRLLGFAQPDGLVVDAAGADASHPLAAGNSTYVFYEIRPGDTPFDETPLGQIAMKVSSGSGSPVYKNLDIPSIPDRWLDSSNSFRTAATVAAYALCLRDSPYKGKLNFQWVESLARQTLLENPEANEAAKEVLRLIIQTRSLAGLG